MESSHDLNISRRSVLAGALGLAGTGLVAACGSRSPVGSAGTNVSLTPAGSGSSLVAVFDAVNPYLVTGSPQRMTFGIAGPDGAKLLDVPASIEFRISRNGQAVGPPLTVAGHHDGVPIGYYPLRTTFTDPGDYQVAATIDSKVSTVDMAVGDGKSSKLVPRGAKMKPFDTPTIADHRGVEPICTRPAGMCPFHTQTLTQALASKKPTAFHIGTPEFCEIGVCGPVLELMIQIAPRFPGIQFIHAEVYTNAVAVKDVLNAKLAPVIDAYGLTYEPVLYVADATGLIRDRLDNVYDRSELEKALSSIA